MAISEVLENVQLFLLGYFWTLVETLLPLFWNEPVTFFMGLATAFLVIDFLYNKNLSVVHKKLAAKDMDLTIMKDYVDTLKSDFEGKLKEKEECIKKMEERIKKKRKEIEDLKKSLEKEQENKEILEGEISKCKENIEELEKKIIELLNQMKGYKDCLQEMKKKKKRFSMVNLIRHKFENKVIPSTLVNVLHKYNHDVLTQKDIDRVLAEERYKGPSFAAAKLLSLLCRYQGWFTCLMKALRDPMVKQANLADHAESALGQVKDEKKQEYFKSAKNGQGEHQIEFGFQGDIDIKQRENLCWNKARHDTLMTVNNFHLELLPKNWQFGAMGDLIKAAGHLTVKVTSKYISDRRPQGYPLHDLGGLCGLLRIGCGMVWTLKRKFSTLTQVKSSCQCHECLQDKKKRTQWGEYIMFTDRHLVYDDDEAYFATLTVTFDNGKTVQLFPVSCHATEDDKDYIEITCVTHDEQVAGKLENDLNQYTKNLNEIGKNSQFIRNQETREAMKCIIIFYSHGLEKCVTVGDITDSKPLRYQALTCPGSTGAPVFILGDCLDQGKYVSTTTHCTYDMTSGIGQSCTWRR